MGCIVPQINRGIYGTCTFDPDRDRRIDGFSPVPPGPTSRSKNNIAVQGAGMLKVGTWTQSRSPASPAVTPPQEAARLEMQPSSSRCWREAWVRRRRSSARWDKLYELKLGKKEYTETTFAERRAQMEAAMKSSQDKQPIGPQSATKVDQSQCEWSSPKPRW